MNRLVTIAAAILLFAPAIVHGQTVAPTYQGQDGQSKEALGTFCVGSSCAGGGGGASTRTTAPGTSDTQAVPVQGVTGGIPIGATLTNTAFGIAGALPAGTANIGAVNLATAGTALSGGSNSAGTIGTSVSVLGANAFSRVFNGSTWSPQAGDAAGRTLIVSVADNTATSGVAPASSTAAEGGRVIKASPGNLFGLNVATGATAGVVQLLNATAVPADGAIAPLKCYYLAANSSMDLNLRAAPVYFSTGIVAVFSSGSSCFTKTTSATAFISGDAK